MIEVSFFKDKDNNILKFTVEGHSGYGEAGSDIVCSAVSILAHTTYVSLLKLCGISENDLFVNVCEETGYMVVNVPKYLDSEIIEKTQIVFQIMEVGIKEMLESYSEYITLKYEEV